MPGITTEITAVRIAGALDVDGLPFAGEWERALPISFDQDWRGENADPQRRTQVQLLWSDAALFLRFACRFRSLTVFEKAEANGRRDYLWERDVAEAFLQPDRFGSRHYKEVEIAPNGYWLDLDITPAGLRHVSSGMRSRAVSDKANTCWIAELALPMPWLAPGFDPQQSWKANFFRCEGVDPQRFYSAWQPTNTPEPQFHVPEAFGTLCFSD